MQTLLDYKIRGDQHRNIPQVKGTWRIPQVDGEFKNSKKANKYLKHQHERFIARTENGKNFKVAARIFTNLLSNSKSFQVYYFNRVMKGGYGKYSEGRVMEIMTKFRRHIKNVNWNIEIDRVYILKADKIRFRPLGVPTPEGRIISTAINDLTYAFVRHKMGPFHHGFIPGRSIITAGKSIMENFITHPIIFEFDLVSYFNKVNRKDVVMIMKRYDVPSNIINFIEQANLSVPRIVDVKSLKSEEELKQFSPKLVLKRGLPQGLSGSPLQAALVMDFYLKRLGYKYVTYADDGLIFLKSKFEIRKFLRDMEMLNSAGLELSFKIRPNGTKATGFVKETLYFLGIEWKLGSRMIKSATAVKWEIFNTINDLERTLRHLGTEYSRREVHSWEIRENSMVSKRRGYHLENLKNLNIYLIRKLLGKSTRNMIMIGGIVLNINKESSYCCDRLLSKMYKGGTQGNNFGTIEKLPFPVHLDTGEKSSNKILQRNEKMRKEVLKKYLELQGFRVSHQ